MCDVFQQSRASWHTAHTHLYQTYVRLVYISCDAVTDSPATALDDSEVDSWGQWVCECVKYCVRVLKCDRKARVNWPTISYSVTSTSQLMWIVIVTWTTRDCANSSISTWWYSDCCDVTSSTSAHGPSSRRVRQSTQPTRSTRSHSTISWAKYCGRRPEVSGALTSFPVSGGVTVR